MASGGLPDNLKREAASAAARVRIGFPRWLRPFLQRNVIGFTLGRRVYLAGEVLDEPVETLERLVRHELEHVRQVSEHGLPRFLFLYFTEYLEHRRSGLSHSAAYRAISFERAANDAERR